MAVVREDAKLLAVCKKCEFFTITEHDFIQMITARDTIITDLKKRCSQYRHKIDLLMKVMNSHQIEEVIDELEAEDFTGAEYFAGR